VNRPDPADGLDVLAKVGGFEIGGIAGVVLGSAARRKPVVVDGFISTAAALVACVLAAAGAAVAVALLLAAWCYRRIGGATGDTFGAVCEIVEIVPALTLATWAR